LKEIRFSPFIGDADYETRLKRVNEFLSDKNKVKLTVVFKGKQLGSKSFGYGLLDKLIKELGDKIHIDSDAKFFGRHLSMIISPKGGIINAESKNKEINN
jgi:translation initiation factor IF-3